MESHVPQFQTRFVRTVISETPGPQAARALVHTLHNEPVDGLQIQKGDYEGTVVIHGAPDDQQKARQLIQELVQEDHCGLRGEATRQLKTVQRYIM